MTNPFTFSRQHDATCSDRIHGKSSYLSPNIGESFGSAMYNRYFEKNGTTAKSCVRSELTKPWAHTIIALFVFLWYFVGIVHTIGYCQLCGGHYHLKVKKRKNDKDYFRHNFDYDVIAYNFFS